MASAEGFGSTLGEAIRRQRELAELPMRQLAAMVGISNPYLSQIERGLRAPSDQVLDAIAESLHTSVDALNGRPSPRYTWRAWKPPQCGDAEVAGTADPASRQMR
jgi:transcriptional regulator with XRE-family HTH domain